MNIKNIYEFGIKKLQECNIEESSIKLKILLSNILNVSKEYLVINMDYEITEMNVEKIKEAIERVCKNEPIQYIINKQSFYGLDFYVDKNVLIPQPDTEILVDETIKISKKLRNKKIKIRNITQKEEMKEKNSVKILDLCTGSGTIAVSLAKNIKNSHVTASDISEKALEIAKKNSLKNEVKVNFILSNLFEKFEYIENNKKEYFKFDIITSNPPYIEKATINTLSEEVKKEPIIALDGGVDGLDFYREIIQNAKKYLNENGYLILEIGYNQKASVTEILEEENYKEIYCIKDYGNNDRVIVSKI